MSKGNMNGERTDRARMNGEHREREEYLDTLTGQIRCKMARRDVAEEFRGHIEDQTRAFMSEGMERKEAEALAVREMGDPVEVGNELDKIHRPRMPWGMIGLIVVLSIVGYAAYCFVSSKCAYDGGTSGAVFSLSYLVYILAGLAVMTGVCFVDYTRIGERARELMIILILGCLAGQSFSVGMVNGMPSWIILGGIGIDVGAVLMLTVPLYVGILYHYRGSGRSGSIKAVLWMLPGCGIALKCGRTWMAMILATTCVVVFEIAVCKRWFRISRRAAAVAGGAAGAGIFILPLARIMWGTAPSYQQERLSMIFGGSADTPYYPNIFIKTLLDGSRLVGKNPDLADTVISLPNPSEAALAGIAGYCGILAALAVAGVLLFLLLRFLHISLKQRNQLGMLMGTGCAAVFLIQTAVYCVNNMGLVYLGSYCPFLTMGGSSILMTYVLLGLLLSICRYRNTAPERNPGRAGKEYRTVK